MTELTDGVVVLRSRRDRSGAHLFTVGHETTDVGSVCLTEEPDGRGLLDLGARPRLHRPRLRHPGGRLLIDYAFRAARLERVEALVDAGERAVRCGWRRAPACDARACCAGTGPRTTVARTRPSSPGSRPTRPPPRPAGFRALLNSFLPRKRAIAQMLVRDNDGRVLLCRLTYKNDFDLPGGVVEVGESPQVAVAREVEEELGFDMKAGALLVTDWLPPWGGWDDALCLVFDGGVADASVLDEAVLQAREIRSAQFCTLDEVRENCADFTARRIEAALRTLEGGGTAYTESGRA